MEKRKKDFRWYLIALLSALCIFAAFLPMVSVYSEVLAAKTEWDLKGVYKQTERLQEVLESDIFKTVTDEEGLVGNVVGKVSGFDTTDIRLQIEKLRQNLLLLCAAMVLTVAVNVICAVICLTRAEMLKYISVIVSCFLNIATALLIRASCYFEVRSISPVTKTISDLGRKFGVSVADVTDFANMTPGIVFIFLPVMALLSGVIMMAIRARR
ncbi:MAG: hypothetical protein IJ123_04935 [Blautia sp.]|nr:hypothetical protein [Blautia sp.]